MHRLAADLKSASSLRSLGVIEITLEFSIQYKLEIISFSYSQCFFLLKAFVVALGFKKRSIVTVSCRFDKSCLVRNVL